MRSRELQADRIAAGSSVWKKLKKQRVCQALVIIGMLYLFIFNIIPMVGILVSFKEYTIKDGFLGIFTSRWAGLKYFDEFIHDYKFLTVLKNTLFISILKMLASFPAPILLAVMLSEVRAVKLKKFVQTASYLPYFISWVIVSGILSALFSESKGLINETLTGLKIIDHGIPFLTSAKYYYGLAVFTSIWKNTGWWCIIFLAAIAGIDITQYEAAMVDGAGRLSRIWHITLPNIRSSIMVVLILSVGSFLGGGMMGGNFEQSMILGNAMNNSASEIIQTYAFKTGMIDLRFNYAAAIDLMQSVISLVLIFGTNAASRKLSGTSLY